MKILQKNGITLILLLTLFTSCGRVYLAEPQPGDAKNKYRFPKSLQGTWYEKDDSITIGKNYFSLQKSTKHTVSKNESDTTHLIVLNNNKVYFINNKEKLETQGVPYTINGDSITFTTRELEHTELGKYHFLRKVNNRYVFNTRNEKNWWEVYLLERTKNKHVIVRVFNKDVLDSANVLQKVHSTKYDQYFAGQLTSPQLEMLIAKGAFSDTIFNLAPEHKIK